MGSFFSPTRSAPTDLLALIPETCWASSRAERNALPNGAGRTVFFLPRWAVRLGFRAARDKRKPWWTGIQKRAREKPAIFAQTTDILFTVVIAVNMVNRFPRSPVVPFLSVASRSIPVRQPPTAPSLQKLSSAAPPAIHARTHAAAAGCSTAGRSAARRILNGGGLASARWPQAINPRCTVKGE